MCVASLELKVSFLALSPKRNGSQSSLRLPKILQTMLRLQRGLQMYMQVLWLFLVQRLGKHWANRIWFNQTSLPRWHQSVLQKSLRRRKGRVHQLQKIRFYKQQRLSLLVYRSERRCKRPVQTSCLWLGEENWVCEGSYCGGLEAIHWGGWSCYLGLWLLNQLSANLRHGRNCSKSETASPQPETTRHSIWRGQQMQGAPRKWNYSE